MLRLTHSLNSQLLGALERAFPGAAATAQAAGRPIDPQLAPASKSEFGDSQANGALALNRPLRQAPRVIATAMVAQLEADTAFAALCLPSEIARPGFINLTLRPQVLADEVGRRLTDSRLGVPTMSSCGRQHPVTGTWRKSSQALRYR